MLWVFLRVGNPLHHCFSLENNLPKHFEITGQDSMFMRIPSVLQIHSKTFIYFFNVIATTHVFTPASHSHDLFGTVSMPDALPNATYQFLI